MAATKDGTTFVSNQVNLALGEHLAAIRRDRKMTLRGVEEATKKVVSNGYLSQIESGYIKQPSPNVLNALADVFNIEYIELMKRAGYISKKDSESVNSRHSRVATFAELNLTEEEEDQMMKYLKFLRADE